MQCLPLCVGLIPTFTPHVWIRETPVCGVGSSSAGGEGESGGGACRARHRGAGERPGGAEDERAGHRPAPANRGQRPFPSGEEEERGRTEEEVIGSEREEGQKERREILIIKSKSLIREAHFTTLLDSSSRISTICWLVSSAATRLRTRQVVALETQLKLGFHRWCVRSFSGTQKRSYFLGRSSPAVQELLGETHNTKRQTRIQATLYFLYF